MATSQHEPPLPGWSRLNWSRQQQRHCWPHLTLSQVDIMKEVFDLFDRDGKGFFTTDELMDVMEAMTGSMPTPVEVEAVLFEMNSNKDGRVDFAEFLAKFHDCLSESHILKVFDQLAIHDTGRSASMAPESRAASGRPGSAGGGEKLRGSFRGSDKLGSSSSMQRGSDKLGSSSSMQRGSDKLGSSSSMQRGSDKLGKSPSMQRGSDRQRASRSSDKTSVSSASAVRAADKSQRPGGGLKAGPDKSGDGGKTLSLQMLERCFAYVGDPLSEADRKHLDTMFRGADQDGSGTLDISEFMAYLAKLEDELALALKAEAEAAAAAAAAADSKIASATCPAAEPAESGTRGKLRRIVKSVSKANLKDGLNNLIGSIRSATSSFSGLSGRPGSLTGKYGSTGDLLQLPPLSPGQAVGSESAFTSPTSTPNKARGLPISPFQPLNSGWSFTSKASTSSLHPAGPSGALPSADSAPIMRIPRSATGRHASVQPASIGRCHSERVQVEQPSGPIPTSTSPPPPAATAAAPAGSRLSNMQSPTRRALAQSLALAAGTTCVGGTQGGSVGSPTTGVLNHGTAAIQSEDATEAAEGVQGRGLVLSSRLSPLSLGQVQPAGSLRSGGTEHTTTTPRGTGYAPQPSQARLQPP